MALLTAREKLDLLVRGKATLREINELENQAENEPEPEPTPEPDEKDKRIAELEAQLKEAQEKNVHGNSGGNVPSFDEQLDNMFKDYRF